jgi:hypothetical protein
VDPLVKSKLKEMHEDKTDGVPSRPSGAAGWHVKFPPFEIKDNDTTDAERARPEKRCGKNGER